MARMEIRRVGRWRYELSYVPSDSDLWMSFEGPTVFGLERARRRAARDLRRLARIHGETEVVAVVT